MNQQKPDSQPENNKELIEEIRQLQKAILEKRRIDRLDSAFLFIISTFSLTFSILSYFLQRQLIIAYITILIPTIMISLKVGYIDGALLKDNFTERIRGWIYLFTTIFTYIMALILGTLRDYLKQYPNSYLHLMGDTISLIGSYLSPTIIFLIIDWFKIRFYINFNKNYTEFTDFIIIKTFQSASFLGIMSWFIYLSISSYYINQIENVYFNLTITFLLLIKFLQLERKIHNYSELENLIEFSWEPTCKISNIGIILLLSSAILSSYISNVMRNSIYAVPLLLITVIIMIVMALKKPYKINQKKL